MKLVVAALSDTGRVRQSNQDQVAVRLAPDLPPGFDGLLVVADGMGGEKGGAVASQLTVDSIISYFAPQGIEPADGLDDDSTLRLLEEAIMLANREVHSAATGDPELQGMGTTCTVALAAKTNVYIGHVGDSRAYLIREGQPFPLTTDHSWVASQVQRGTLTAEQAEGHPEKNLLLRAVGPEARVQVDTVAYELQERDLLLLCSDGLTNMVAPQEIASVAQILDHPRDVCAKLVELANERGGLDNVSAVVARPVELRVSPSTDGRGAVTERVQVPASLLATEAVPRISQRQTRKTFLNFLFAEPFFTIWLYGMPGVLVGLVVALLVLRVVHHA